MARVLNYNIGINRDAKPFGAIKAVIVGLLTLWVGEKVINSIRVSTFTQAGPCYTADTSGMFYQMWQFLGVQNSCEASTNGILGVIGLLVFAYIVLRFVKITKM